MNLQDSLKSYDDDVKKINPTYSGILGLQIEGEQRVEHPIRNGFVYVRLRDNLSEVVQAFNDKVSPVYNLPVIVERRDNKWFITGRDVDRYSNWGSSAPFLPKHGFQHSFNREENTGGDVVLIYPDQFMPLLVYPNATGAGSLSVSPYLLQRDSDFIYVGGTTPDLLPYRPTSGSQAVVGLVYLNTDTGGIGVLINSGTYFPNTITGTAGIAQYIPYPASNQEPLYVFRLTTGTESLQWENLYNARQFIGGGGGGSGSSGGGSIDPQTANRVIVSNGGGTVTTDSELRYNYANNVLVLGDSSLYAAVSNNSIWAMGADDTRLGVVVDGTATEAPIVTLLKRGGGAVENGEWLGRMLWGGYDGTDWGEGQAEILGFAPDDWSGSSRPTRLFFYVTPIGATTSSLIMQMMEDLTVRIEDDAELSTQRVVLRNIEADDVVTPDSAESVLGVDDDTQRLFTVDDGGNVVHYASAANGSFTTTDLKTVTVVDGVITSIV